MFIPRKNILIVCIALIAMLFSFQGLDVAYAGVLILDVNIAGDPTTVQTGELVEYIIDFSCGGLATPCGDLTITVPISTDVFIVNSVADIEITTSVGYTGVFDLGNIDPGTGFPILTITDNENGTPGAFADGDSSQAIVRARVRYDLTGTENIPFNVTGEITTPDVGGATTVTEAAPLVPVATPVRADVGWQGEKVRITPPASIGPSSGGEATYEVAYCADTLTGNTSINDARIVDTFPANATIVAGSFTDENGNPTADETVVGNEITWNLGAIDIETLAGGTDNCIRRRYTLSYPAGQFPVTTDVTNTIEAFEDNPNNPGGTCTPPCNIGADNPPTDEIDPPTALPTASKGGPGTTLISPLNTSNSVFTIALNTTQANVPIENLILRDSFPKAQSDPNLPAIEIIEVTSGEWADNTITAQVQFSTDDGGNWTDFPGSPVDGSSTVTFPSPGTNVTDVRWVFQTDVPAGFNFTTNPTIRFDPNSGLDQTPGSGDFNGSEPGGTTPEFRDYTNCPAIDYDVAGTPQPTFVGTGNQCANARFTADPVGITNIAWSKSAGQSIVNVGETISFTLDLGVTQEASGDLINPTIEDILPQGLRLDTTTTPIFNVTLNGGPAPVEPYVQVVDTGLSDQLIFYWNDTVLPGSLTSNNVAPGAANPLSLSPPLTGVNNIQITFNATVELTAIGGPNTNSVTVVADSPQLFCQSGTQTTDTGDIDGDNATQPNEVACTADGNFEFVKLRKCAHRSGFAVW